MSFLFAQDVIQWSFENFELKTSWVWGLGHEFDPCESRYGMVMYFVLAWCSNNQVGHVLALPTAFAGVVAAKVAACAVSSCLRTPPGSCLGVWFVAVYAHGIAMHIMPPRRKKKHRWTCTEVGIPCIVELRFSGLSFAYGTTRSKLCVLLVTHLV